MWLSLQTRASGHGAQAQVNWTFGACRSAGASTSNSCAAPKLKRLATITLRRLGVVKSSASRASAEAGITCEANGRCAGEPLPEPGDAAVVPDVAEAVSPDDPQLYLAGCYDFLTWLQESLIQALMGM